MEGIQFTVGFIVIAICVIAVAAFFVEPDRKTQLRRERKKAFREGDFEKGHAINKEFDK